MTAGDEPLGDDRTDAERLEHALHEVAMILRDVVGLKDLDARGDDLVPRVQVDLESPVDLDGVSYSAYLAACNALECVAFGLSVMDLDTPTIVTVEQGLAAMTSTRGMPC